LLIKIPTNKNDQTGYHKAVITCIAELLGICGNDECDFKSDIFGQEGYMAIYFVRHLEDSDFLIKRRRIIMNDIEVLTNLYISRILAKYLEIFNYLCFTCKSLLKEPHSHSLKR